MGPSLPTWRMASPALPDYCVILSMLRVILKLQFDAFQTAPLTKLINGQFIFLGKHFCNLVSNKSFFLRFYKTQDCFVFESIIKRAFYVFFDYFIHAIYNIS